MTALDLVIQPVIYPVMSVPVQAMGCQFFQENAVGYSAKGFSIAQVDSAQSQNVTTLTHENAYVKAVWAALGMRLKKEKLAVKSSLHLLGSARLVIKQVILLLQNLVHCV